MSEDIFANWRDSRFIIIEYSLFGRYAIILTDYQYWNDEIDNLIEWCSDNGADMSGMSVEFPTEELLTLFTLRWS